jgi:putative Mn2+ efflux pump MntP
VLIAAVSNLDNLAAAITLGPRGTRISIAQNALIGGVTMAGTAGAMTAGAALAGLLTPHAERREPGVERDRVKCPGP